MFQLSYQSCYMNIYYYIMFVSSIVSKQNHTVSVQNCVHMDTFNMPTCARSTRRCDNRADRGPHNTVLEPLSGVGHSAPRRRPCWIPPTIEKHPFDQAPCASLTPCCGVTHIYHRNILHNLYRSVVLLYSNRLRNRKNTHSHTKRQILCTKSCFSPPFLSTLVPTGQCLSVC